ncbi:hypothetical protein TREMEDRAFT_63589 [Tremella mesenterica DSM 1558]|uniref:uncharacterized protein n=1 Tax=Tremella mesenterica (strain ATCC 24925 / CBS 8224 / DSM 1558 / NBRC 9311 / NRRL Y-6157 / RJB 2259-6 / UBC 559-6) TaxID=578456 RepID=UPI0003F4A467|nr:uncharacterized protein TREMEDRAFT_63589 [Tremella mesenterica DSM 1558]EIW68420.1 hypothetical protein TREMEDRAFT_63589 [Tremella mesenterica DSM 1558]
MSSEDIKPDISNGQSLRRLDFSKLTSTPLAPRKRFVPTPVKKEQHGKVKQEDEDVKLITKRLLAMADAIGGDIPIEPKKEPCDGYDTKALISGLSNLGIRDETHPPLAITVKDEIIPFHEEKFDPVKFEHGLTSNSNDPPSPTTDACIDTKPPARPSTPLFLPASPPHSRPTVLDLTESPDPPTKPQKRGARLSDLFHSDSDVPPPRASEVCTIESDDEPSIPSSSSPSHRALNVVDAEDEQSHSLPPSTRERSSHESNFENDRHSSPARPPVSKRKTKRSAKSIFIDQSASDDCGNLDDDPNESLGSLRDFIVDDDVIEYASSSDELESPPPRRKGKGGSSRRPVREVIDLVDDSDDDVPPSFLEYNSAVKEEEEGEEDETEDILYYSPPPKKTIEVDLPDLSSLTIDDTPPKSKKHNLPESQSSKKPGRRAWPSEREGIARKLFKELDKKVFDSRLGPDGADAQIEWNKRLLKTAGQAHTTRERLADGTKVSKYKITLSEKVLTGEEQILNTVAHEMCHLATWIINDDHKNPHGKLTKRGRRVMRARPDIEVTTTHSYVIEYKYEWKCSNESCTAIYRRHSKSIDVEKERCGRCKCRLVPMFQTKSANPFQVYLKTYMSQAKAALPGSSHGEVMRALSKRWSEAGEEGDHEDYWKNYHCS